VSDGSTDPHRAAWRERQRLVASARGAAEERRRATEAARGRELIAEFVREAVRLSVPPERLTAAPYGGGARYRTRLRGWYLRRDRSVAVGVDGEFYVLTVPGGLRARVSGAAPVPEAPRLIIGEGARDGESMPLADLLNRRLTAGSPWP
jgi:hypothetical protein